jgi:hypothetical protein
MTIHQTHAQTRPPLELVLFAMAGTVTWSACCLQSLSAHGSCC